MGPDASIQKLPSNIRSLDLTDKKLTFIPVKFSKKSKLTTFILSKNDIHELPKNLKKLKTLVMSFNNITEINSDMLEGLLSYPCIESLDFSYNSLHAFPSQALSIKTLQSLTLFGNQITSLNCSSDSQLTFLDLGRNKLATFPAIPETLQTLILDCNELTNMNKLSNTCKINKFCISRNQLENFNPTTLFPVLTTLDVSNNKLNSLPNFSKISPHLRQFDASNNFITELPQFPRTLSEIIIRNNRIKDIPSHFTSLPCLIFADFSQNEIEELPALPRVLQTLIIYDNKIKTTQQTVAIEMFRLYLMNNQLEEVPLFKSNALAEYYLSSNRIKAIKCKNLSRVANRLDFSNNLIEQLPGELFAVPKQPNATRITHIFAHHNRIEKLPPEFLQSEVIALSISQNPISELPDSLPATLESLFLSGCGLTALPRPDEEKDDVIELVACYNRLESLPFYGQLVCLNLAHNSLKKLPKLPETIQFLDVSGNAIDEIDSLLQKDDNNNNDSAVPLLRSLDLSCNMIREWPSGLCLKELQTLKLRGNVEMKGNFGEMKTMLPSLEFLDATETELEFTDESIEAVGRVLVSEGARVMHVKRKKKNVKVKAKEEEEEEKNDRKVDDEKTASSEKLETKSKNGVGEEEESKSKDNDDEKREEQTTNNENSEKEEETSKSDNNNNNNNNESENESRSKSKSSEHKEEAEEETEDDDDEGVYLKKFPSNAIAYPRTEKVSYSTFRHEREANEDVIIIRSQTESKSNPDNREEEEEGGKNSSKVTFAAVFDARSSGKVASKGALSLSTLLDARPIEFTSDYFTSVCSCVADIVSDKSLFDGSSVALCMSRGRELFYATVGDMRVIVASGQKDGGYRVVHSGVESNRRCGNKTFGQLAISKIVGDYLVYGTDIGPKLNKLDLKEDDRFVVLICAAVFEMLSEEQFGEIFGECGKKSAREVTDEIKYTTMGSMSSDNISVVVIDVSS